MKPNPRSLKVRFRKLCCDAKINVADWLSDTQIEMIASFDVDHLATLVKKVEGKSK